jgi:hypothetical protein
LSADAGEQMLKVPFTRTANTRKHYSAFRVMMKLIYCLASAVEACFAIYPVKAIPIRFECNLNQIKHSGPVAENNAKSN